MTNEEIIKQIKDFWCVDNFKNEILYWKFETDIPTNMTFHIGHPTNSHKGTSVGDILPYTRLPQVIKENYSECIVTVPEWFWPFFKSNPYVDNISNKLMKWGSLGTFGTSVQRTCNVWGVICKYYTPRVYINNDKYYRTIAICVNSKTGGKAKNIHNVLKEFLPYFRIYQIGTSDDQILTNVHEYIFNITRDSLINILSKFE